MTKSSGETKEYQQELARRIKEVFASQPRGFKKQLADACGVSPQSLGGWVKTGTVTKQNLAILSKMTGYDLYWLITGEGQKLKITPTIYDMIDAESRMNTQQKSSFKTLFNSITEQAGSYSNSKS